MVSWAGEPARAAVALSAAPPTEIAAGAGSAVMAVLVLVRGESKRVPPPCPSTTHNPISQLYLSILLGERAAITG